MNFDIDRSLQLVEPLDDGDIDYDAFLTDPLDADTLRCLRYMHDIEFHTTCYLRDLLVTAAHDDPEITAFLAASSGHAPPDASPARRCGARGVPSARA
jgi:hypothetical protein